MQLLQNSQRRLVLLWLLAFCFLTCSRVCFLNVRADPGVTSSDVSYDVSLGNRGVVDLAEKNFTKVMGALRPNEPVLMELYANWCPHCRHFKPTYDSVGSYFMSKPRVQPQVFVGRLDCALEENNRVCGELGIKFYPTLKFALAKDFANKDLAQVEDLKERDAEGIVKFVGQKLKAIYLLDGLAIVSDNNQDRKATRYQRAQRAERNQQVDIRDIERATVESFDNILRSDLLATPTDWTALVEWVTLLASAHPSSRCQVGAKELLVNLDRVWHAGDGSVPAQILKTFHICGNEFKPENWGSCRGSSWDTRGLTCGIWLLLHSLANRVTDDLGGVMWMKGVSAFIKHFFQCKKCAEHFSELLDAPEAQQVKSRKDVVMWLWEMHNRVNARLAQEEEAEGTGDPQYPKSQWPLKEQCRNCAGQEATSSTDIGSVWNKDKVFLFLTRFYGEEIIMVKNQGTAGGTSFQNPRLGSVEDGVALRHEENAQRDMPGGYEPLILVIIVVVVVVAVHGYKRKSKNELPFL